MTVNGSSAAAKIVCFLLLAWLSVPLACASLHPKSWVDSTLSASEPRDSSRFLPWSLTMWGQHRSNTMDHQLGQLLVRGGNIDRTLVDAAREIQGGDMGSFGFSSGIQLHARSRQMWKETNWRLCGSVQARWIGDSRWTPEMYDLVLTGNAGHLGRWDVLDGTRARSSAWLNAAVGIEGRHQNRVELGLVYRPFQYEGLIETGYFYVNEDVDDMFASMRAKARLSRKAAWGLALNAEWHFLREEAPFAFHVQLRNFGAVISPNPLRFAVDTVLETSGLPFSGAGWSIASLQEEGFAEGLYTADSSGVDLQRLPGRLDLSFEYPLSPRTGWDVQVQVGEWMPLPRAISGLRRAFGKHWQAGVQVIAGGWGRVRPAAWARWRMPNERAIMIYVEDPWGWGSDSAYGRGVTLRYESL